MASSKFRFLNFCQLYLFGSAYLLHRHFFLRLNALTYQKRFANSRYYVVKQSIRKATTTN